MIDATTYGPWAVIAGGSEGVGAAIAAELADAGLNLVLLARKPGPLENAATALRAKGAEVRTLSVDLISADAIQQIRAVTDDLDVGLLVYNAGANTYGHEFVTGELERFRKVIDLNITAQLALVQHFGVPMCERGQGGILLIGSLAGYMGAAHIGIYAAVKAFCRVFAEGLWLEMKEHNVDVLEFVLGVTRTPAMERIGLNLNAPGIHVSEPDDVARQALAQLKNGPVQVAQGNEAAAEQRNAHAGRAAMLTATRAEAKHRIPSRG
ncbi:SDR family NAD(P)-dependent oxidoreductase [Rhodococcus globerulus]|uniref:SDR family NAD(P)-dependent oxidoreductase n=1 Tax=Rhodococcus globerulus TaxID=33008 RepID=UPI003015E1CB